MAYVASTNMYWASGRYGRLVAYDPRAPSNITEFVKEANGLDRCVRVCGHFQFRPTISIYEP